jgi:two-component system, cell cycle sensor histidine kinase PleC
MRISERRTSDGGYVGVWTNVTAQKKREFDLTQTRNSLFDQARQLAHLAETLQQARRSADRANEEKSRFLASMSHELRTPLNAILGFSDLIRNQIYGPLEPPRYREYIHLIHKSGSHLLALINDVLDLSKIEAGKMELDPQELDAHAMLAEVSTLMVGLAAERGVKLETAVAGAVDTVWADRRAIKQILINLLSNAVKFTSSGGHVLVTIDGDAGESRISVSDDGIGMSADDLRKALQPYGQVRADIARRNEGTGLGLPLAKSLTELHGGQLDIRSEKGKGTTVVIRLPRRIAQPPPLQLAVGV